MNVIIKTFITAILPVVEIRGAIPVGISGGLSPFAAFFVGLIGNMLPVPFLILLTRRVIEWLTRHDILTRFTSWLKEKSEKNAQKVQKYSFWGLFVLVAIPLPGTGAWTGALVASMLDMRLKRALPAITLGVICAGLIILGVTCGLISVGSLL